MPGRQHAGLWPVLLTLLVACLFQWYLLDYSGLSRASVLSGDEFDYVGHAELRRSAQPPPPGASNENLRIARRMVPDDVRPGGYPLLLAASGPVSDVAKLRQRMTKLQLIAAASCLAAMAIWLACAVSARSAAVLVLLGGAGPWLWDKVSTIGPDSLCMSLSGLAIVGMAWSLDTRWHDWTRRTALAAAIGCLLICGGLRAEMKVLWIAPVLLAVFLATPGAERRWTCAMAALAMSIVVSTNVRLGAQGVEVAPTSLRMTPGLVAWFTSWRHTETDLARIPWRIWAADGPHAEIASVPAHAFKNPEEASAVRDAFAQINAAGRYTDSADRTLQAIANKRRAEQPLEWWAGVPLSVAAELWLNPELNRQTDHFLSNPPAPLGFMARYGGVLRGIHEITHYLLIALACATVMITSWRWRRDPVDITVAIAFCCIAVRTSFFAGVVRFAEARYVLPVWPALLMCAASAWPSISARLARSRLPRH